MSPQPRTASQVALATASVVIVGGLFARRVAPQVSYGRFDVFVDVPADLRPARKIQRKCVRDECGLVIDGSVAAETPAQQIWSAIAGNQLLHKFVQRLFNGSGSGVDGSGVVLPAR
ncbi:hypothetical protein [Streptomyces kronopolitis]|uniref:hypothetical protein n=1 Tax=Streptomyces kronopolitis TaxID=1612435 RepID=UPI0036B13D05